MALRIKSRKHGCAYELTNGEEDTIEIDSYKLGDTFRGNKELKRVELYGIVSIGHYAFEGCTELTEIELPATVREIYNFAFSDCPKLFNVKVDNSITEAQYMYGVWDMSEGKPFSGLLHALKDGHYVKLYVERTPCDDDWR